MEKKYSDLRSGTILVVLSFLTYFWLIPAQIKTKANVAIGADFFPKLTVIICGVCGLILAIQSAYDLYKGGNLKIDTFKKSGCKVNFKPYLPHLLFLLAALAYLLVMPYAGFVLSSIPFLIFLLWFFGHTKIKWCILISVIYIPIVYMIFSMAFRIRFPSGPFGF